MNIVVFTTPPEHFHASLEVASCHCEWEDKFLLLKRHPQKSYGNKWGLPAGKLEKGETPRMGVVREVEEEVGLQIDTPHLRMISTLYCRLPHLDYLYHMFGYRFASRPEIRLALTEHLEMRWVTFEEALQLPLIVGGADALHYYKQNAYDL